LEEGTFRFSREGTGSVEMEVLDLAMILEGIDGEGVRRRKRYHREGHGVEEKYGCRVPFFLEKVLK
jgi:hypothetical protein